ncbi:hypothetical protein IMM1_37980 [Pseudocoprococcus immobilis]
MDNRWRFLYCIWSELWGHGVLTEAGKGKTGPSAGGVAQANPCNKPKA